MDDTASIIQSLVEQDRLSFKSFTLLKMLGSSDFGFTSLNYPPHRSAKVI